MNTRWVVGAALSGALVGVALVPAGTSALEPCTGPWPYGDLLQLEVVSQTIDGVEVEPENLPRADGGRSTGFWLRNDGHGGVEASLYDPDFGTWERYQPWSEQ